MNDGVISNSDKFMMWDVTEIHRLNENTAIVKNNSSGVFMVKKTMDKSMFELHRRIAEISCKNIAKIYDVCVIDDKCVILEELVHGQTIDEIINSDRNFFTPQSIKNFMLQLCSGLAQLHRRAIVHRDINPSNVMITYDGILKIIDFGISRVTNSISSRDTEILGTVGYAAPEQFGFRQTDDKCDIYAVGALYNYMLTGFLPNEKPAPGFSGKIIKKCTNIDPEMRYNNIKSLRIAISDVGKMHDNLLLRILRKIPGFRTKNPIFAFISIYYYFTAIGVQAAFINMWWSVDKIEMLAILGRFQILFMLPFVFYSDFLDLSSHLPILKTKSKRTRKTVFAILGTISLAVGIGLLVFLNTPDEK